MKTHPIRLMIDFETPSTSNTTAPLTFGAVQFKNNGPVQTFYDRASLASIERRGFAVDVATMEWWDKQDPQMRAEAFGGTKDIEELIESFIGWCEKQFGADSLKDIELWSRGSEFDCAILQHVCMKIWGNYPFDFRKHRCQRTLESLIAPESIAFHVPPQENKHNALQDAIYQARVAEAVLATLGLYNAHTTIA